MFSIFSVSDTPRRLSLGRMIHQSTALLMVSIGSLIFLLAVLVLFHENANATKGYQLRKLESDRSEIFLEQEVLNMRIAEAQALQSLKDDAQIARMVPPKNVRFMKEVEKMARR